MSNTRNTQFEARGAPLPDEWTPQRYVKPVPTARECWAVAPFLTPQEWLEERESHQDTRIDRSRVYKLLVETWRDPEFPREVKPTVRDYMSAAATATMQEVQKRSAGDLTAFQTSLLVQCLSGQRVQWPDDDKARMVYATAIRAVLSSETYAALCCRLGWFPPLQPEPDIVDFTPSPAPEREAEDLEW